MQIVPTIASSSGETLRQMALNGMGIVCLADFMTTADREEGRLVEVLADATLHADRRIQAVYYRHSAVSARIASMVQYLSEVLPARH